MRNSKKPTLLRVVAVTVGTLTLLNVVGFVTTPIAYPTEAHRDVAKELRLVEAKAFTSQNPEKLFNSDSYKELSSSPETQYSMIVSIGSGLVQLVLWIALIVTLYKYIRRSRVTKRPILLLASIEAILTGLVAIPLIAVEGLFVGASSLPFEPIALIPLVIGATLVGFGLTALAAKLVELHYNRNHGFEV